MQQYIEYREDPGAGHRGDMSDLAFGICGVTFIILCVTGLIVYGRKRRELQALARRVPPQGEVIDAQVVETTALAASPTHQTDTAGRKVCRFCGGYSPTWYRPRTLVLDEGWVAQLRLRWRLPPVWLIEELDGEAQDVCARHHLIEAQTLAQEIEERRRMYEATTTEVMRRHQDFVSTFHDKLTERSMSRGWRSNVETF